MEENKAPKYIPKSELRILSQEIGQEKGHFRILAGNRIYYLMINCDVYDEDTMSLPYLLIPSLPEFPDTEWTTMHVSKGSDGSESPVSYTLSYEPLPAIESTWHPTYVDILSLPRVKRYSPNVYEVLFNERPAISKIACWEWEIPRLENETYVYSLLNKSTAKDFSNESPITPGFLGHLTENGRVIGILMEKVEGGFALPSDLAVCQRILCRVHSLGIIHGDVNRYNFLIDSSGGGQVRLIDFEHAEVFDADKAEREVESLVDEFNEETKRGAPVVFKC